MDHPFTFFFLDLRHDVVVHWRLIFSGDGFFFFFLPSNHFAYHLQGFELEPPVPHPNPLPLEPVNKGYFQGMFSSSKIELTWKLYIYIYILICLLIVHDFTYDLLIGLMEQFIPSRSKWMII